MATLPQRFKLLATRCAAGAPSPSRSPAPSYAAGAASPGYRLRRRRGATASGRRRGRLRRFLCRRRGGTEPLPGARQEDDRKPLVGRAGGGGRTLRDLFVASPEAGRRRGGCGCDCDCDDDDTEEEEGGEGGGRVGAGMADPAGGAWRGSRRFGSGGLRNLLLRRSWRPVLGAIPEGEGKIELGVIEE
ncbi:uncharacterized protein LOC133895664 [Phragmites australis]|uniref:uncharacterized protein LOC133895664 n=1 Tax=Phragmites australis TaxID=29695 RepID=UPI002D765CDB|nr:uncharacterized protein LOC133895664 [Phragmites australis]